jgi:hypothetical protein
LTGYIPNLTTLARETQAWETQRNISEATIEWRFTTADARIKLKRLYPVIHFGNDDKKIEENVKESLPIKA